MIAWYTASIRLPARLLPFWLLGLWLAGSLAGCTSVRPTLKIGVLAPFEGLHRRSGYAALDAVRAAIADFSYRDAGILPLALDDSAHSQQAVRSVQKLLADPRVAAVVGPLSPALGAAVEPVGADVSVPWYTPYSIAGQEWASGLVGAAAALAREQTAAGLVLAGWTPGWPSLDVEQWAEVAGMPVRFADEPTGVEDGEVVFWMGSAEDGAAYLAQLRDLQPTTIFVLGPQGEDPVFVERVRASGKGIHGVYWTIWTDSGYTDWTASHSIHSPNAYLVYRAALAALQSATIHSQDAPPSSWVVQLFRYDDRGNWFPAN
jgi:hypothetical protein